MPRLPDEPPFPQTEEERKAAMTETEYQHPLMKAYWTQLDTGFKPIKDVFEDVMAEALAILSREGIVLLLEKRIEAKFGQVPDGSRQHGVRAHFPHIVATDAPSALYS